jgi:hypothetical protein
VRHTVAALANLQAAEPTNSGVRSKAAQKSPSKNLHPLRLDDHSRFLIALKPCLDLTILPSIDATLDRFIADARAMALTPSTIRCGPTSLGIARP